MGVNRKRIEKNITGLSRVALSRPTLAGILRDQVAHDPNAARPLYLEGLRGLEELTQEQLEDLSRISSVHVRLLANLAAVKVKAGRRYKEVRKAIRADEMLAGFHDVASEVTAQSITFPVHSSSKSCFAARLKRLYLLDVLDDAAGSYFECLAGAILNDLLNPPGGPFGGTQGPWCYGDWLAFERAMNDVSAANRDVANNCHGFVV